MLLLSYFVIFSGDLKRWSLLNVSLNFKVILKNMKILSLSTHHDVNLMQTSLFRWFKRIIKTIKNDRVKVGDIFHVAFICRKNAVDRRALGWPIRLACIVLIASFCSFSSRSKCVVEKNYFLVIVMATFVGYFSSLAVVMMCNNFYFFNVSSRLKFWIT